MLCIIDEFSRESLAIPVAQKLKATDLNEFVSGSPPLAPLLSELLLDCSTDLEEIN